jgi:hypothetical protein
VEIAAILDDNDVQRCRTDVEGGGLLEGVQIVIGVPKCEPRNPWLRPTAGGVGWVRVAPSSQLRVQLCACSSPCPSLDVDAVWLHMRDAECGCGRAGRFVAQVVKNGDLPLELMRFIAVDELDLCMAQSPEAVQALLTLPPDVNASRQVSIPTLWSFKNLPNSSPGPWARSWVGPREFDYLPTGEGG